MDFDQFHRMYWEKKGDAWDHGLNPGILLLGRDEIEVLEKEQERRRKIFQDLPPLQRWDTSYFKGLRIVPTRDRSLFAVAEERPFCWKSVA